MKYRLMAFLILAESKLKSWIIKYGHRESVEKMLHNYVVRADAKAYTHPTCHLVKRVSLS